MNQQEQYAADVATGYPRPWELWEYEDTIIVCGVTSGYEFKPCAVSTPKPFSPGWHYRRRPDADEMIRAWQEGSIRTPKSLEPAIRQYQHNDGSGFVFGFDRDETVKLVNTLEKMLAEICDIAEDRVRDCQAEYKVRREGYEREADLDQFEKELATIARAKELL